MISYYEIKMQHTEESFEALSHMQYDLFCGKNRIDRTIISLAFMVIGVVHFMQWWGILMVAYGCYLTTSTYVSSNRAAHKLSEQIKSSGAVFPSSSYVFGEREMEILCLPERKKEGVMPYSKICRMGEDGKYFYIFRDEYGGYMIPKEALGDDLAEFRGFLEKKTGQEIRGSRVPVVRLMSWFQRRKQRNALN